MEINTVPALSRARARADRDHSRLSWSERCYAVLLRITSAIKTELRVRRAAAELASMDDRMLRDIGISRGEIDAAVRRRALLPTTQRQLQRYRWPDPFRID